MVETGLIILGHQLLFQGMFVAKNMVLRRKLGQPIRGSNREANAAIGFFALFITAALVIGFTGGDFLRLPLLSDGVALGVGVALLLINLGVSGLSLLHLKDSWRVGVIETQHTALVSTGNYRFTRNPYFVTYLVMFAAYTVLLQNLALLGLAIIGFFMVHRMILKEEAYLLSVHGDAYRQYRQAVPRYLFF
jgi:protein-S-isoprenylcysteine O-methyltransferase Ste14